MRGPALDLAERLDASLRTMVAISQAPGAIGAVVAGDETAVLCQGDPAPDAHTLFELGSIGKTCTALLLAEMVTRGEVGYDDPITAYLPPKARPRRESAASITLEQLATHTAGLPRNPANFYLRALPVWRTNPFARYRLGDLYRATAGVRVRSQPGTRVRYSNFGVGLLGQLLANAAGGDYRELVIDRICRPLGMTDTRTRPGPTCATGHRRGHPVPGWEIDALAPAGTLRSSATDLCHYLQAQLRPETTPLDTALRATQTPRVAAEGRDHVCLVWNHRRTRRGDLLFHAGATRGFTAFVGFCPQAGIGVAALVNAAPTRTSQPTLIQTPYSLLRSLVRERQTGPPVASSEKQRGGEEKAGGPTGPPVLLPVRNPHRVMSDD